MSKVSGHLLHDWNADQEGISHRQDKSHPSPRCSMLPQERNLHIASRKTRTAVVLATLFFLLFAVPSAYAASTTTQSTPTTRPVAATHPSASCPQPNRNQAISTLTLQERLDQGYPMPVNGKTDPHVDQMVHDKGVHFCADTDVSLPVQPSTSINTKYNSSNTEYNSRIWSGNFAGGDNYTYVQIDVLE